MTGAQHTLFENTWAPHVVADLGDGYALLHVDRNLLHDLSGARGLDEVARRGLAIHSPHLSFSVPDHAVSTLPGRTATSTEISARLAPALRDKAHAAGIRHFDVNDPEQGIVHVIGPELGLTLPGLLITCGDSHTSTHGALGALAFGIGSTEIAHVLATQTIVQKKPRTMRVSFEGALPLGVTPKDMILHLIGTIGTAGGDGYAVEYAGAAIRALPIEGRLTICNMSIEFGAKMGQIAPDDITYEDISGRRFAPTGAAWDAALAHWRTLPTGPDAVFDHEIAIAVEQIEPQITGGTSPAHTPRLTGPVHRVTLRTRIPNRGQAARASQKGQKTSPILHSAYDPDTPMVVVNLGQPPRYQRVAVIVGIQHHTLARGAKAGQAHDGLGDPPSAGKRRD